MTWSTPSEYYTCTCVASQCETLRFEDEESSLSWRERMLTSKVALCEHNPDENPGQRLAGALHPLPTH